MPCADQRAAGVGYLKSAVEYVGASVGVHGEKIWQGASLEDASQESGNEGVSGAYRVNHFDRETRMSDDALSVRKRPRRCRPW